MMVLAVENAPASLRGRLALWLVEARAGLYVGDYSPKTRDLIWKQVEAGLTDGNAILIWQTPNDSGFSIQTLGPNPRTPIDMDGIQLMQYRTPEAETTPLLEWAKTTTSPTHQPPNPQKPDNDPS